MGGSRKTTTVNCKEIVRGTSLILLCSTPCSRILPWVKINPPASSAGRLHPLTAPLNTTQKIHGLILDKPSLSCFFKPPSQSDKKTGQSPLVWVFLCFKTVPTESKQVWNPNR